MTNEEYPWYQLKYAIAEFMVPKLESYKANYAESGASIPSWVADEKSESYSDEQVDELKGRWLAELDQMITAFTMVLNNNTGEDPSLDYDESKIQQGVEIFAKHYQHLWD